MNVFLYEIDFCVFSFGGYNYLQHKLCEFYYSHTIRTLFEARTNLRLSNPPRSLSTETRSFYSSGKVASSLP